MQNKIKLIKALNQLPIMVISIIENRKKIQLQLAGESDFFKKSSAGKI